MAAILSRFQCVNNPALTDDDVFQVAVVGAFVIRYDVVCREWVTLQSKYGEQH